MMSAGVGFDRRYWRTRLFISYYSLARYEHRHNSNQRIAAFKPANTTSDRYPQLLWANQKKNNHHHPYLGNRTSPWGIICWPRETIANGLRRRMELPLASSWKIRQFYLFSLSVKGMNGVLQKSE
jgi:hypothetical protein